VARRRRDRPVIVDAVEADAVERLAALAQWIRWHRTNEPRGAPDLDAVETAADGPGTAADRVAAAEQVLDILNRRAGFETYARWHAEFRRRWCPGPTDRHGATSTPERRPGGPAPRPIPRRR
jgi:hypothetical protein